MFGKNVEDFGLETMIECCEQSFIGNSGRNLENSSESKAGCRSPAQEVPEESKDSTATELEAIHAIL